MAGEREREFMGSIIIILVVGLWVLFGWLGWVIGQANGRSDFGVAMGLLFGPIGLLIVACMPPVAKRVNGPGGEATPPSPDDIQTHLLESILKVQQEQLRILREVYPEAAKPKPAPPIVVQ